MNKPEKLRNCSDIPWPETVTELHVHLGGSVPLYRLWEMGLNKGVRGLGQSYEEFIDLVKIQAERVHDLDSYLEIYDKIELIQSGPDAVRESILIAIHGAYRTGGMKHLGPGGEGGDPEPLFKIGRLELRFNPLKRTGAVFLKGAHAGLYDVDRVIRSAIAAIEEVEIAVKGRIEIGLICCFGRDMTHEANMTLAHKVATWQKQSDKIVGIDLAGPESVNPLSEPTQLSQMQEAYKAAGEGVGRTVHVGETPHVNVDTLINTIRALEPQRVAHPIAGLRAYLDEGDDRALQLMRERGIVCELCVKSNLLTGAVKSLDEYRRMIRTLDDFSIPYTFSTDAPALQVSSLGEELVMLLDNGVTTEEQVLRALHTAEDATFLNRH